MPGCGTPVVGKLCDVAGDAAGAVAGSFLDQAAKAFADSFGKVVKIVTTGWVNVPTPSLDQNSGPVGDVRAHLAWIVGLVGVFGLLVAMGKLAVDGDAKHAKEAAKGLVRLVAVTGALVPAVALLTAGGDSFSVWIIDRAAGGDVGGTLAKFAALSQIGGLGSAVLLLVGILGVLSGIAQLALMGVRIALLVVLAGTIPVAAAASTTERGRHSLDKMLSWFLAFALYKPVAAIVYAAAFWTIGDGQNVLTQLAGVAMLMVAILALPAFMKLIAPAVSTLTSSAGSGAGVLAGVAGAATLASGAGGGGMAFAGAGGRAAGAGGGSSRGGGAGLVSDRPSGPQGRGGGGGASPSGARSAAPASSAGAGGAQSGAAGTSGLGSGGPRGDIGASGAAGRSGGTAGSAAAGGASGAGAGAAGGPAGLAAEAGVRATGAAANAMRKATDESAGGQQ